jgi:arylsulfatase A-like enzyme
LKNRRQAAVLALAALVLGCAAGPEIRNVVLVSFDAVGARHVGCYGYARDTTPNLDAVAREGVLFESAYTQQTWTLTSHITMLNGLNPRSHGASEERRSSPAATSLPEILWAHGFATAAFTGGVFYVQPQFGLGRGFERYEMGQGDARVDTQQIVGWLREQRRLRDAEPTHRFFLFVHYFDAHSDAGTPVPYHVPPPDGLRYLPPGPPWGRSGGTDLLIELKQEGPTERDLEFLTAFYDAGVRYVDEHGLGPLLAALDELDLADETLLVLTADHGEEIFEHGSVLHGYPYDETARVPLVFRGPGIPGGRRVPHLVALVDLMPTILSLLSLGAPLNVQGRDLGPLLHGGGPVNDAVYVDGGGAAYPSSVIADLDGRRWSYFAPVESRLLDGRRVFRAGAGQLFALDEDPLQQRDLAAQEPAVARRLEQRLLAWFDANEALARRLGPGGRLDPLSPGDRRRLEKLGYVRE